VACVVSGREGHDVRFGDSCGDRVIVPRGEQVPGRGREVIEVARAVRFAVHGHGAKAFTPRRRRGGGHGTQSTRNSAPGNPAPGRAGPVPGPPDTIAL